MGWVGFDNCWIPAKVPPSQAQMAELVDALGSGPSGGNTVEVRVLFWAPYQEKGIAQAVPFFQLRPERNVPAHIS